MTQDNSPLTDLTYLTYKTKPTAERFVVGKKKEVKIMNDNQKKFLNELAQLFDMIFPAVKKFHIAEYCNIR